MKRFVITLLGLSAAIVVIVIAMHAVVIYRQQALVDEAYTLGKNGADVLFIGSSQVGCSIEESPRFHNQKLWVSDTISQSFLMRLKELERRDQLKKVKVCVVPFNLFSITSQNEGSFLWAWYQEIPVSWRYLDMLPCGLFQFVRYIACNLRCPFLIHVSDLTSPQDPLIRKPENYRRRMRNGNVAFAKKHTNPKGKLDDWEKRLPDSYAEMQEICARNGVRLIIYKAPLISYFENALPPSCTAKVADLVKRLQGDGMEYVDTGLSLGEESFRDVVHLVRPGASVFTTRLYEKCKLDIRDEKEEKR